MNRAVKAGTVVLIAGIILLLVGVFAFPAVFNGLDALAYAVSFIGLLLIIFGSDQDPINRTKGTK